MCARFGLLLIELLLLLLVACFPGLEIGCCRFRVGFAGEAEGDTVGFEMKAIGVFAEREAAHTSQRNGSTVLTNVPVKGLKRKEKTRKKKKVRK
jgi:hypothetical protein